MEKPVIIDGIRTAFGSFGGSLKGHDPIRLGTDLTRHLLEASNIDASEPEEIFFGNVIPNGPDSIYLARHIGLKAGLPISTPALTLNRLCGSGLEAVAQAAGGIALGRLQLAVAGGVENMSQVPFLATGARWGNRLGSAPMVDLLLEGLTDSHVNLPMGGTAENLARAFSISREEQDEWASTSQKRAEAATQAGRLAEEIMPVNVRVKKEEVPFAADEFIRGEAGASGLAKLRPAFQKDGTVTAGNASGINDGASVMLVASETYAKAKGIQPLARILGWAAVGCAPEQMGIGPVHAIPAALKQAGLELSQMDLVEVNEAFAAQYLAVQKQLKLDPARTNVNGGAIAIGHPLGASGNRVLLTLCKELKRRGDRYGVASLCIGGGQGIAMVVESQ
jgi:acetyl-CoA C-acetyltransferase